MFLSEDSGSEFEFLGEKRGRMGWSLAQTVKMLFAEDALMGDEPEEALKSALYALSQAGIVKVFEKMNQQTWGLNPEALELSCDVHEIECQVCRHKLDVAVADLEAWQNARCFRPCPGHYQPTHSDTDYYGRLYGMGQVNRVFSREHTGLLERAEREELENRFRSEGEARQPFYPRRIS